MKNTIDFLESKRRNEELLAEGYEATNMVMKSIEHWTNENALSYVIQVLKADNNTGS